MRIYFLRHADALSGMNDAVRPLSPEGIGQANALGRHLEAEGVKFGAAYSSPYLRTRETAELVLTGTQSEAKLELAREILDEIFQYQFEDWLSGLPDVDHMLLVGHAPILAGRVRQMAGLVDRYLDLPKGGMACVETSDRKTGELKFFIEPRDYV